MATVKLAAPGNPLRDRLFELQGNSGPLGFMPGRGRKVEIHGMNAAELAATAYRVPLREVAGPSWIFDARFDIDALIPEGQSRDKAPDMLLTLLQERLALKAHRDVRKTTGYILSVAEGGPKLKEAGSFTPSSDLSSFTNRPRPRSSGFSEQLDHCDMAELANVLAQHLEAPVEDRTGLKGFYSISIQIPAADMKDPGERPSGFREALRAYGLHLASGKIEAPTLVIDNLSKTPTPN